MRNRRTSTDPKIKETQDWFKHSVTYEGEAYVIDAEQAAAVVDQSKNTIVVARAGSGKTRTIVAKIVYLVAKCNVKPDEIMVFVFNANAAAEINARLSKMLVDGKVVIEDSKIASTFHSFARSIVYGVNKKKNTIGQILAGEKEDYLLVVIEKMLRKEEWAEKIDLFTGHGTLKITDFAKMMAQFVNRAQQNFLAGTKTLSESAKQRLSQEDVDERERIFIELGVECFRRYHWYLLNEKARRRIGGAGGSYEKYGTDFNLIVSWASKMIASGGLAAERVLGKKYILIDEYQDFSQLFLSVVLAIRKVVPEVKLFVVGDDWQAINRFAGSDVEYFKEFEKFFVEDTKRLEITTNYRCDYLIVNTAKIFMKKSMNEKGNFRAKSRKAGDVIVVDPRNTELNFALVDYDWRVSEEDLVYKKMTERMLGRVPKASTVKYMKTLASIIHGNIDAGKILLLHRNNETNLESISLGNLMKGLKWGLMRLGWVFEEDFDSKVEAMTIHKSKGLEAEVVILLEIDEGVIPKLHPDTRLYRIFGETDEISLDDQKRLFYVAMTRAKKRLYIIHNPGDGPGFVRFLGTGVEKV